MARKKTSNKASAGGRNLRVGEEIRHALAALLQRGEVREFESFGVPVTVTEVRVSPDLRHATAYVMPLGGQREKEILSNLKSSAVFFRKALARAVKLQFVPNVEFKLDESFAQAEKIAKLIEEDKKRKEAFLKFPPPCGEG